MEAKVKQAQERGRKKAVPLGKRVLKGAIGTSQRIMKFAQSIDIDKVYEVYGVAPPKKKKGKT